MSSLKTRRKNRLIGTNKTRKTIASSYAPSVNNRLVKLRSVKRHLVKDCNNADAFDGNMPLKIAVPGTLFETACYPYSSPYAVKFLLKNLRANKHIDVKTVIPPKQLLSNCWFNTMFVAFFVSDKGRKFFHFFRQLMIEGLHADGKPIPKNLRDAFALLNYGIDATLTGNEFAYTMDTNAVIRDIYAAIPEKSKKALPFLTGIRDAGNPLRYYVSIMHFLENASISLALVKLTSNDWKQTVHAKIGNNVPHILCLETHGDARINTKPKSFHMNGVKYALDSCIIRDISGKHFSLVLTGEKQELAYDGASHQQLEKFEWKKHINSDYAWNFDRDKHVGNLPVVFNFMQSYQMLFYYR